MYFLTVLFSSKFKQCTSLSALLIDQNKIDVLYPDSVRLSEDSDIGSGPRAIMYLCTQQGCESRTLDSILGFLVLRFVPDLKGKGHLMCPCPRTRGANYWPLHTLRCEAGSGCNEYHYCYSDTICGCYCLSISGKKLQILVLSFGSWDPTICTIGKINCLIKFQLQICICLIYS